MPVEVPFIGLPKSSEKSGWSQVGLRASFLLLLHCAGCTGNTEGIQLDRASQTKDVKRRLGPSGVWMRALALLLEKWVPSFVAVLEI